MKRFLLALALLCGCSKNEPVLHLKTWPNYFAPDTVSAFEKEAGCRVVVGKMESSEALRTELSGGASGYDVVFPSDEVLPDFIARGLIQKLDLSKLPNAANLLARYRNLAYDPKNEYSLPYMWGSTGIAYNKEKIGAAPDSWAALWDPKHAAKVTLLDDPREVFAAAVRADGGDPGKMSEALIAKALARFKGWKPVTYESSPKDMLVNGDAWISQCYSGDALQASDELKGKIGFVIPKEGGTLWIDNLCIAKGAPQPELAHKFIDYLLRAEVSAAITNAVHFPNPNEAARKLIKKEVLDNPLVNPTDEDLKRLSLLPLLAPEVRKKLDEGWAQVKGK
ncbi:MAG: spermidine/putrescine ABC transporter substrate-binding protein [Planctomycetes bacterium]|nr:spermidine/putrescine ABC transporter substrate-binding protein [Planctomycetota bacterium]